MNPAKGGSGGMRNDQGKTITVKLPDGTPLCYKGWTDGVKTPCPQRSWFRTEIRQDYLTDDKKKAMVLSAWSPRSSQRMVIADFDRKDCPDDQEWGHLEARLEDLVRYSGDTAFVIFSITGNPKLVFVVDCENMNDNLAEIFLLENLPKSLHWFDRKGMSRIFMGRRTILALKYSLACATPMPWDPPRVKIVLKAAPLTEEVLGKETFQRVETLITELRGGETTRKILSAFFATPHLWDTGAAMPQRYIAECLDVSTAMVNKVLHALQNLGHIECIDPSYLKNVKAMTWKGKALFFRVWQKINGILKVRISNVRGTNKTRRISGLPDAFTDGASYELLYTTANLFCTREDFLAWVASLTGVNRTRMMTARRVYASFERNRHRKPWLGEPTLTFT